MEPESYVILRVALYQSGILRSVTQKSGNEGDTLKIDLGLPTDLEIRIHIDNITDERAQVIL